MGKLSVAAVKNAKAGRHADGEGLYLIVKPTGGRSWLLRIQVAGRRRDIGLGSVELSNRSGDGEIEIPILHLRKLSLSQARDKCALLRKAAQAGLDPIVERDKGRRGVPTFAEAASACYTSLKDGWSAKQQQSFLSSLERHVYPELGSRRVDDIEASEIQRVLEPIWLQLPEMARKVRQRISTVLNYSRGKSWRASEAPGKSLTMLLPKSKTGGNYAAMPYSDVPTFVARLVEQAETMGRMALLFAIYTAGRSGEVRNARWTHIDLDRRLWTRPAALMKSRSEHVVTLNEGAMTVLERAKLLQTAADAIVFPGFKGSPLSDMTLSKIMRDDNSPFKVHGFRSSFRDWAAERMPDIPDPVAEAALAHAVPTQVVKAYKRTNFIEMRRVLLEEWSKYIRLGNILSHIGDS